jgi:hypothetical protein
LINNFLSSVLGINDYAVGRRSEILAERAWLGFETGRIATIWLLLRRTLVRFVILFGISKPLSIINLVANNSSLFCHPVRIFGLFNRKCSKLVLLFRSFLQLQFTDPCGITSESHYLMEQSLFSLDYYNYKRCFSALPVEPTAPFRV